MAVHRRVDVVTIGAGWTAAILAWKLGAEGVRVVSIDQGPIRWTYPDFQHNHDSLRYTARTAMMVDLASMTWTWRPHPEISALPMRQYGSIHPGQGLGGAGIHWAAQTWRFYPTDHLYRSHHIDRYGEDKLPEFNRIQDWPVTYEELEPYYTQVEYDIGLSGVAGNLRGDIQSEGNPFEGARAEEYPLPPLVRSIPAGMFSDACRALGYHPFRQPAAILSRAYRGVSGRERAGCLYCGFCTRFGCEVDAKASPITDHIPLALDTGNYEIRANSRVIRINQGADGLATGVTYIDRLTGEEHEQPADVVIVSAYTLENIRLLLLSTGPAHPDGIGNDRGMVGKNYTYQLVKAPVTGVFEDRRFNLFMGNSCLQDVIHDLNADNFDHTDLDFVGGASITCGGGEREPVTSTVGIPPLEEPEEDEEDDDDEEEEAEGRALIAGEIGSLSPAAEDWGESWKENLRQNWDSFVSISIQGESLPYEDQFCDLDPHYRDEYGLPLLRVTYDFHENDYRLYRFIAERCREIMEQMGPTRMVFEEELEPFRIYPYQSTHSTGGCIMGASPEDSVTNKYGQVWDTPNVFVTGAALYPQNPGMNPTGPLLALAYMTGDAMVEKYLRDTEELMD
jgi:gluconate 2-dehydrogenase alpha chain